MYEFTINTAVANPAKPLTVPMPQSGPGPATTLKECRCIDCRHWDDGIGICWEQGLRRYVPREEYHRAMRRFWTDLGMIDPAAIHYCAGYMALWRPTSRHVGPRAAISATADMNASAVCIGTSGG